MPHSTQLEKQKIAEFLEVGSDGSWNSPERQVLVMAPGDVVYVRVQRRIGLVAVAAVEPWFSHTSDLQVVQELRQRLELRPIALAVLALVAHVHPGGDGEGGEPGRGDLAALRDVLHVNGDVRVSQLVREGCLQLFGKEVHDVLDSGFASLL